MVELISVYYNNVSDLADSPSVEHDCPHVFLPRERALYLAEQKVKSGEWERFIIPSMLSNDYIVNYKPKHEEL